MICPHCPVDADRRCPGLDARRACELVDPGHRDHIPGYAGSVVAAARPIAAAGTPSAPPAIAVDYGVGPGPCSGCP